ncbi:hypothetical protein GCM10010411_29640 [Actinomadura fulvescens]|uniref:Uncharacterized protein n=1 Tax=Actinomadura fulvescens TaxID=46160 RepID=A0ABN3PNN7_9ACTN
MNRPAIMPRAIVAASSERFWNSSVMVSSWAVKSSAVMFSVNRRAARTGMAERLDRIRAGPGPGAGGRGRRFRV